MDIFQKVWKYKLHYVIVLPAMLPILLLKIVPLMTSLVLPFKDYNFPMGLAGSPWAGFGRIARLFADPSFGRALANTLAIKISYVLVCGALSLIVALAIGSVRSARLTGAVRAVVVLPYFIPGAVAAYIAVQVFSTGGSPLSGGGPQPVDVASLRWSLILTEAVRTCGIPVMMALAAIAAGRAVSMFAAALRAVAAFMLLQLSTLLTTDFDLIHAMIRSPVYGETLDEYKFRAGFMMLDFSAAGAVWLLQFAVHLILTMLAYMLVRRLFIGDLFGSRKADGAGPVRATGQGGDSVSAADAAAAASAGAKSGARLVGAALAVAYAAGILFLLCRWLVVPFFGKSGSAQSLGDILPAGTFVFYLQVTLAAAIVHMLMTLTLAFPLTVRDLPGRSVYKALLIVLIVAGTGTIAEYMTIRNWGMTGTYFPYALYGFFNLVGVFVLKAIFNARYGDLKEQAAAEGRSELYAFFYVFVPKVWKPLVALGILQFALVWNSYLIPMLYTSSADKFTPVLLFRTIALGGDAMGFSPGDPLLARLAAIVSLPGIVLLLAGWKLLKPEVFVSQIRRL